jgi:hypothetical protein
MSSPLTGFQGFVPGKMVATGFFLLALVAASQARPQAAWGAQDITTVHVVQGCHLDVGFIKSSADIINLWFDQVLCPAALMFGGRVLYTPLFTCFF